MFQRRDPEWSYETLQNKRRIAESLAAQIGAPRNVGEGLSAIGKALAARGLNKKADAREAELRGEFDQTWGSMFGGGQSAGGGASMPTQGATIPRVTTRTEGQAIADDAMAALMRQGLIERGLPPHVADGFVMNAQDESGLRTDINEIAPLVPGSRGGFGLMQWTGPRRVALEQEAASRGVDPSDMNLQLDFLVSELQGPEARAGEAILSTSDVGTAAQAIVNQFLRPAPEHRERRAAQYGQSGQDGGGFDMQAAAEIAGSPFASPAQRAIAQALMERQIAQMYPQEMTPYQRAQLDMREREFQMRQAGTWGDGTNVNVSTGNSGPQIGSIPQGYQLTQGEDGAYRMEPIPGGPADTTQEDANAQAAKATSANIVLDEIGIARDLIGGETLLSPATGITGGVVANIDSTRAGALKNRLDTIKANIGFDKLQAMRDASPTGGALGQVSEFENRLLQAVFGSLVQSQRAEDILYNLDRLEGIYDRIINKGIPDDEARQMYAEIASAGFTDSQSAGRNEARTPDYSGMTLDELVSNPPTTEAEAAAWNRRFEALQ